MKNNCKRAALVMALFFLFAIVSACDTAEDKTPYLIVSVNLDEMTYPVSEANQLFIVFYAYNNWTIPWFTMASSTRMFVTPRLTIGNFPFYFEVIYDDNGDGQPSSGDIYQGWNGATNRGADLLTSIILPNTDLMILNIDLDNNGVMP